MSPTWSLHLRMPDSNPIFVASSKRGHRPPDHLIFYLVVLPSWQQYTFQVYADISFVPIFPGRSRLFGDLNISVPASHKIRFGTSKCPAFLQLLKSDIYVLWGGGVGVNTERITGNKTVPEKVTTTRTQDEHKQNTKISTTI